MIYDETPMGITRLGNYLITKETDNTFTLSPLLGLPIKHWLEEEIVCTNIRDAERIATIFTTEEELTEAIRHMAIRRGKEKEDSK